MNDKQKIAALVSMLLGFRDGAPSLADVIDRKLGEICPEEAANVEAALHGGWQ